MKTKKQLAAAAAAAAAAAERKAAQAGSSPTATAPITVKKPVKRLQPKAKESSLKPIDPVQPTTLSSTLSTSEPLQVASPKSKQVGNPKSPSPIKQQSTSPLIGKNVKTASSHPAAGSPGGSSAKKSDATKVKKCAPAAGGKKPSGGGSPGDKKKIQKELKNLGITDKAINQIDTATVECNPSISEMVKTKSRATVSQQKCADFGGLGGPSAAPKTVAFAANFAKQEGSSENPKPSEPVVITPTKKKPVSKTKDTKQDSATAREEGAKNKAPVTAQLPTPSAPTSSSSHSSAVAKEDVKVPVGAKNAESKTKAKKLESKDDNSAPSVASAGQQQLQHQFQKAGKKISTTVSKAKPKSKKAILEEKRAAEAKAAAEAAADAVAAVAAAAAAAIAKQEAEDKQRMEDERTCSLELVESDDKNDEEEVQSRIEDIVKSLEDDDDDEMGMKLIFEEPKIEPKVNKEEYDAKKKLSPKVVKGKTDTEKKLKKQTMQKFDEIDNKNPFPSTSMMQKDSTSATNQGISKPTTDRKYTKPKIPAEKSRKSSVKKQKPESKRMLESLESNQESPRAISETSTPISNPVTIATQPTDTATKRTNDPNASEPTESPEPPKSIRSSTENDDDLPLTCLKNQSKPKSGDTQAFSEPQVPTASAKSSQSAPVATAVPSKPPSKTKRKYIRKTSSSTGAKKKLSKAPSATTMAKDPKEKKPTDKKDVYDFDESESETDSPVKQPGKPIFKRKQLEANASKEEEDLENESLKTQKAHPVKAEAAQIKQSESECEKDHKEEKKPAKKLPAKSAPKPAAQKKESESEPDETDEEEVRIPVKKPVKSVSRTHVVNEASTDSNAEETDDDADDKERDPDERPATPVSKKVKQEVRDSSDDESDGYTSEESVRTRIVKKQLTAKTRHLKLYGFWSGPKRHRVASLNAIAKVHCLYENETRTAFEASLMKQVASRAPRGKELKKEKIEEETKKSELAKDEDKKKGDEETKKVGEVKAKDQGEKPRKEEEKKHKVEEKKHKEEEKKKAQKTVTVKEEKKKVVKKAEPKEDKKKESKKVEVKEEKRDDKKKEKEKKKEDTESDSESEESEEEVVTRTLRCVPGLRGVGKHWDPDASSMESGADDLADSDETYTQGKDTDPVKKRKIKRKVVKKPKPKPKPEKSDKPKPAAKKIKKEVKALLSDAEKQQKQEQTDESSSSSASSEKAPTKPKSEEAKKRKREPKEKKEVVEVLGKKRMASLNATAMLAATYEVQRILYRNTDSDSDSPAEKPKSKKAKEQKEAKEKTDSTKAEDKKNSSKAGSKDAAKNEEEAVGGTKPAEKDKPKQKEKEKDKNNDKDKDKDKEVEPLLTVKTEPMRDRMGDSTEVKHELEEPRPVSNNVVIAQDTEVTITGVYVNSGLGASQEAYCKMQYRVQQSVTEERLVRPGEAPPKSYTPLTALSSMRPPNDQATQLSTPPLFGQPAQCDSPLGLGGPPRGFYPPPTSSSGSSSAFCAPIPHDSPGKCSLLENKTTSATSGLIYQFKFTSHHQSDMQV